LLYLKEPLKQFL